MERTLNKLRLKNRHARGALLSCLFFCSLGACSLYDRDLLDQALLGDEVTDPAGGTAPSSAEPVPAQSGGAGGVSSSVANSGGLSSSGGTETGSAGGFGGGDAMDPPPPRCVDHPLSSMQLWSASASETPEPEDPERAIDLDDESRWSSADGMSGDEWFLLDFGAQVLLTDVLIRHDGTDYARGYEVLFSEEVPVEGAPAQLGGKNSKTDLALAWEEPHLGRYLLIRQTGGSGSWWSILEIEVTCND